MTTCFFSSFTSSREGGLVPTVVTAPADAAIQRRTASSHVSFCSHEKARAATMASPAPTVERGFTGSAGHLAS